MDTSWWPALGAVLALALLAAIADGRLRGRRGARGRGRPPGRAAGRVRAEGPTAWGRKRPRPGEIWWALVPYESGSGAGGTAKDRPCLVLAVHGDRARIAKITSRYRDERPGVIPLPPGSVGDNQGRGSFLETDALREVPLGAFRRRSGVADPAVWDQVRHLAY